MNFCWGNCSIFNNFSTRDSNIMKLTQCTSTHRGFSKSMARGNMVWEIPMWQTKQTNNLPNEKDIQIMWAKRKSIEMDDHQNWLSNKGKSNYLCSILKLNCECTLVSFLFRVVRGKSEILKTCPTLAGKTWRIFKRYFWESSEFRVQSSEQHFVSFSLDFQNQMLNFFLSYSLTYFCFQASSWSFPSSFFCFWNMWVQVHVRLFLDTFHNMFTSVTTKMLGRH